MKNLITILFVLVGCMTPAEKFRNSVVGSYEVMFDYGRTFKLVFLKARRVDATHATDHPTINSTFVYVNDERKYKGTWRAVEKEVHVDFKVVTSIQN